MSLLLMEGFDWLSSVTNPLDAANNRGKINVINNNATYFGRGEGRGGLGYSLRCEYAAYRIGISLPSVKTNELTIGWAFKPVAMDSSWIMIAYNNVSYAQLGVGITDAGNLRVARSTTYGFTSSVVLEISADPVIVPGQWHYLEFKFFIANAPDGYYELHCDGVKVCEGVAVDTMYTSPNIAEIQFTGSNPDGYIDDIYILDDAGSRNNDFLGPVRVATLVPDGAGADADWTPSAGTNHEAVDELDPDDDTTYVESATTGDQDRHAHGNLAATVTDVHGVSVGICSRLTEAGVMPIKAVAYDGTTEAVGADIAPVFSADYIWNDTVFEDHPSSAAAWTPAEVNAGEFGFKIA